MGRIRASQASMAGQARPGRRPPRLIVEAAREPRDVAQALSEFDGYDAIARQATRRRPGPADLTIPIFSRITAAVADWPGIPFDILRRRLPLTDSELAVHMTRLEHVGVLTRLPGVGGPRFDVQDNPLTAVLAAGWTPGPLDRITDAFADAWFDIDLPRWP